jgi:flagellin
MVTTGLSSDQLAAAQDQVEAAITALTTAGSKLGSVATNLTSQTTFTSTLSDSLTSGVGSLVDADMNQASTRLNALQTQQQLGIQSLSIANQNTQLILKLFQ